MSLIIANPKNRTFVDPFSFMMRDFFPLQKQSRGSNFVHKANVSEYEDRFELDIAAPGYERDHLSITVENDKLLIAAKVEVNNKEEGNNFRRKEFSIESFSRSFQLDETIDQGAIQAQLENGGTKNHAA